MEFIKQVRMVLWSRSFRHKIKLLHGWAESRNENTRTMALMLLSILQEKDNGPTDDT